MSKGSRYLYYWQSRGSSGGFKIPSIPETPTSPTNNSLKWNIDNLKWGEDGLTYG